MYLRHPNFIQLSINGKAITNLINPYNKLMIKWAKSQMKPGVKKEEKKWFIQDKTKEFAIQLFTQNFLTKLQNFASGK